MSSQRWTRRPAEVEAIRLDAGNVDTVAAFCGGRADVDNLGEPLVRLPSTTIPVRLGDWAVRDVLPDGLGEARAIRPVLFEYCYRPEVTTPLRHRRKDADG